MPSKFVTRARKDARCTARSDRPARPRVRAGGRFAAAAFSRRRRRSETAAGVCRCRPGLVTRATKVRAPASVSRAWSTICCGDARKRPAARQQDRTRQHAHALSPGALLRRVARRRLRRIVVPRRVEGMEQTRRLLRSAVAVSQPATAVCGSSSRRTGWETDALQRQLGVYYRVDKTSVVDMQAAILEVGAIYVSSDVHDGWDVASKARAVKGHVLAAEHSTDRGSGQHRRPCVRAGRLQRTRFRGAELVGYRLGT